MTISLIGRIFCVCVDKNLYVTVSQTSCQNCQILNWVRPQCKHFSIMKSCILSFASGILAAFLRYFREFESDMGGSNPILIRFHELCRAYNDIIGCIVHTHDAVLRLEESNRKIMIQLQSCIEENQTLKYMLTDYRRENQDFQRVVLMWFSFTKEKKMHLFGVSTPDQSG